MKPTAIALFVFSVFSSCSASSEKMPLVHEDQLEVDTPRIMVNTTGVRTIHVFVALCDNKYQGIVPVPASIGNGQDPVNNLYWGCTYGIKTFFCRKNSEWKFLGAEKNLSGDILERIVFRHKNLNVFLVADAYDGRRIKQTITDFFEAAAGRQVQNITSASDSFYAGGASDLVAYIGHNGLMDFSVPAPEPAADSSTKETIILSCASKSFFGPYLKRIGADPLLWTTNLMAPEAYTLHDALAAWLQNKSDTEVKEAAAKAYAFYQKCNLKAARNLLVTGW